MEQEQFEALVKRLEIYARAHPRLYGVRVGLLAGLGYAYLFFVLAALLLTCVLLGLAARTAAVWVIKLSIPIIALIGAVLRALWVKFPPLEGVPLKPSDAPRLFGVLEETRKRLRAPRPDSVLLNHEFNASVTNRPRLGIFGWPRRYLILGYPLMQALTPEQFRAVVAHEFGHASGNHGRFAGWIYRVRQAWSQLLTSLQQNRRRGSGIFIRFFEWYAPLLNAYSFVLARAHEYQADHVAGEVTNPSAMAESLIAIELRGHFLGNSFWPDFWKQAAEQREPPAGAVAVAGRAAGQALAAPQAHQWLVDGFNRKTDYLDTHPALNDRLAALGFPAPTPEQGADHWSARLVEAPPVTAASELLGANAEPLAAGVSALWQKKAAPAWRDAHAQLQQARKGLEALREKARSQSLSVQDSWQRAVFTLELEGADSALPLLHAIVSENPEHVSANYHLGRILLSRGDSAGVGPLEKAMSLDPMIVAPGCRLLSAFYAARGQTADAQACIQRALAQDKLLAAANRERAGVKYSDAFEPHSLSPETLAPLLERLSWFQAVQRAYLVRKKVQFFPKSPFYVLGVLRRRSWYERNSSRISRELAQMIAKRVHLEGKCTVVVFPQRNKWKKSLAAVGGSEIYIKSNKVKALVKGTLGIR